MSIACRRIDPSSEGSISGAFATLDITGEGEVGSSTQCVCIRSKSGNLGDSKEVKKRFEFQQMWISQGSESCTYIYIYACCFVSRSSLDTEGLLAFVLLCFSTVLVAQPMCQATIVKLLLTSVSERAKQRQVQHSCVMYTSNFHETSSRRRGYQLDGRASERNLGAADSA